MLRFLLILLALGTAGVAQPNNGGAVDPFTMSLSPPPRPGTAFTITWTPTATGAISLLLDYYFVNTPNQNIIEYSDVIAENIPNAGSFVWNVPLDLIAGRYSFSIRIGPILTPSTSAIFTIDPSVVSSISKSLVIQQTTACLTTSSTAPTPSGTNPFLIPDYFRVRAGRATDITWVPTTAGTVTLVLMPNFYGSSIQPLTLASNIQNSGSFSWTPDIKLTQEQSNGGNPEWYFSLVPEGSSLSSSLTSNSSTIILIGPSDPMDFKFAPGNPPPVLGTPFVIMWDPSNAFSVSLIIFGGISGGPTVSVTIADHVPNNGSFLWQVPTNQPPIQAGYWTLSIFNDDTTNKDATISFVINSKPALPCVPSSTSLWCPVVSSTSYCPNMGNPTTTSLVTSSKPYTTRIHSTNTAYANGIYAQDLQITSCSTLVEPQVTSIVVNGITTDFFTVGCQISALSTTSGLTNINTGTCHPEYQTFSVSGPNSVCCPSYWSTSLLRFDSIFCFTTTEPPSTLTAAMKRTLVTKSIGAAPTFSVTRITLYDIIFTPAGTFVRDVSASFTSSQSTPTVASPTKTSEAKYEKRASYWQGWPVAVLCFLNGWTLV